ncbi:MAG: anhydro-N-acetylmuramic acid kinase [Bacteroidota bacterium]
MNLNWKKVFNIVGKPQKLIIGLMSGTSLDGLDIALCRIQGSGTSTRAEVIKFQTLGYEETFKDDIKEIFSKRLVDLEMLTIMNEKIALVHAEMVLKAIEDWEMTPSDIDIIASHGQTIFHAPRSLHLKNSYPNATLQIGDGDHIAVKTGIITICDFRQKNIAAGGEGAPLAVYGDYLLFSKKDEERILLNIGGIANFTYLPADQISLKIFSTDVGPGNTIMDHYVHKYYNNLQYDDQGKIAGSGIVNIELLDALMDLQFFNAPFPKTTGPELFNLDYLSAAQNRSGTAKLGNADVMATLNQFTAQVIIDAIRRCTRIEKQTAIYFSGGGAHNVTLTNYIKAAFPTFKFDTTAALGVNPDAKEAILFALLANETLAGETVAFGNNKMLPSITMGKICLPF